MSARVDTFFAAAREAGARYVVFDRIPDMAPLYLHPVLLSARDRFCVVKGLMLENAAVLRLEPNAPTRTGVAENAFRVCDAPQKPRPAAAPPAAPAPAPAARPSATAPPAAPAP
jgi:hypothetical protein